MTRDDDSPLWFTIIGALVLGGVLLFFAAGAWGHESLISQNNLRNRAGEWCCGEGDCFVVRGVHSVSLPGPGYRLPSGEFVHQRETLPSPDGQFHRCHRPDGTTRCFFAPPPAM